MKVDKLKFIEADIPTIFHEPFFAMIYYVIELKDTAILKFSAQGELSPIVKIIGDVIAVGVDQSIGFYNIHANNIIKVIRTDSFFYDFVFSERYIFIICEVDVIILDKNSLIKYDELSFDEYIKSIDLKNNIITINFLNDTVKNFKLG